MNRLTLVKQIPLAVCLACAFATTSALAQNASTDPVQKLCKLGAPLLGLPTGVVVAVAPTSNCPLATTEIQTVGETHNAALHADGTITGSSGGIRLVSHVPNSGVYVYAIKIPPGSAGVHFNVDPGPETAGNGSVDEVTANVQDMGIVGGEALFQVDERDDTLNEPLPDTYETSNGGWSND